MLLKKKYLMSKINYKTLLVPSSKNFSEFTTYNDDNEVQHFEASDESSAEEEIISNMQADAMLLALLSSFNDRQKVILVYQILRESGYNLNHEDCAKTLSITREHYMFLLADIKKKAKKIIQLEGI